MKNKNWAKKVDGKWEFANDTVVIDNVMYFPATDEKYRAAGYKRVLRNDMPTEETEGYKWQKTVVAEDDDTVTIGFVQVPMPDDEYYVYCINALEQSDQKIIRYIEGDAGVSKQEYETIKARRSQWREFVRKHGG